MVWIDYKKEYDDPADIDKRKSENVQDIWTSQTSLRELWQTGEWH